MLRSIPRVCLLALVATALGSAPAWADVISPDQDACRGKAAGTTCTIDGKAGHCQASTCSRLDYSNGTPPTAVNEPCQVCVPDPAKGPPPVTSAKKDKGCAVSGEQGAGGSMLLGLALLLAARRRRR